MGKNIIVKRSEYLSVPSGQRATYRVEEDGIHEVIETYDQYGKPMYAQSRMIMSKEAFIEAYNTYIKDK